jgi:hypothetical protein
VITLNIPLYLWINGRRTSLSRNAWESYHHTKKTEIKRAIRFMVLQQTTQSGPVVGPYEVRAYLWSKNYNCDLSNFCDVALKIVTDALVTQTLLDGDTVLHGARESRVFMGIDKKEPHLRILYTPMFADCIEQERK